MKQLAIGDVLPSLPSVTRIPEREVQESKPKLGRPKKKGPKTDRRIQVNFTQKGREHLHELMDRTGIEAAGELVRDAIRVYDIVTKHECEHNNQIIVRDRKTDELQRLIFIQPHLPTDVKSQVGRRAKDELNEKFNYGLQMNLKQSVFNYLEKLKSRAGADNIGEMIRDAVRVYSTATLHNFVKNHDFFYRDDKTDEIKPLSLFSDEI